VTVKTHLALPRGRDRVPSSVRRQRWFNVRGMVRHGKRYTSAAAVRIATRKVSNPVLSRDALQDFQRLPSAERRRETEKLQNRPWIATNDKEKARFCNYITGSRNIGTISRAHPR